MDGFCLLQAIGYILCLKKELSTPNPGLVTIHHVTCTPFVIIHCSHWQSQFNMFHTLTLDQRTQSLKGRRVVWSEEGYWPLIQWYYTTLTVPSATIGTVTGIVLQLVHLYGPHRAHYCQPCGINVLFICTI